MIVNWQILVLAGDRSMSINRSSFKSNAVHPEPGDKSAVVVHEITPPPAAETFALPTTLEPYR